MMRAFLNFFMMSGLTIFSLQLFCKFNSSHQITHLEVSI